MKVPVPDDYALGDGLTCFQVKWPDTPQWIALLHGFISAIGHGRFWDESTGVITDAQAIAREIWEATIPLVLCNDCGGGDNGNGGPDNPEDIGAIIDAFGDVLMTNCSIPYGSLRWLDGALQYRYCGEWYNVDGTPVGDSALPGPSDDDYVDFPDATFGTPTSCSKATVIADMMFWVVAKLLDDADVSALPWTTADDIHKQYPSVSWGDQSLLTAYLSAVSVRAQGYANEAQDPTVQATIKCMMADASPDGAGGWDADARSDVQKAINNACSRFFTLSTFPTAFADMSNLYIFAYRAIGANDTYNLTQLAYPTGDEDCGCPGSSGTETWELLDDWYLVTSLQSATPQHWTLGTDNGNTVIGPLGAYLEANTVGSDKVGVSWSPPVQTGTITRVKVECLMNDAWVAANPWVGLGFQVGGVGNYLQGELIGTNGIYVYENAAVSVAPGSFYVVFEMNADDTKSPIAPIIARIVLSGTGAHPLGL